MTYILINKKYIKKIFDSMYLDSIYMNVSFDRNILINLACSDRM